jgi:hypothetical protein
MPITSTCGRDRFFNPYCTALFTIVATLFQFSPYWRTVPSQLNSRANLATALDKAVVTVPTILPRESPPLARRSGDILPGVGGNTTLAATSERDRSFPTRCFRISCTSRQRCRHTPDRSSRWPSRSM